MGIKSLFKHLLLTTAVLSIYACGGGGESSNKTETIIEIQKQQSTNLVFADQNLTDCVQTLIDSEGYTLVEQIKQLDCSDKSITDIEGIQNLSSLELLNLSNNQIRDITPISKLGRLKQLYLQGNDLQLLSPITENQLLEQADISDNDAIICSEQTQLEDKLGDKLTKPEACIEGMQQAETATFEDPNLQACIRQTAQDIGAQYLEQIQQLKCVNHAINDVDGIEQLSNLRELDLTQNNISDITPLQGLALLKKVLLGKNQISNIQPLTTSEYMQELRLDYNQLTDIQDVQTLDALRQIHLTNNQIRDLTPLQSLTGLLELRISNNRIIDIDSLANLPKLSSLWIQGNQIADLTPLQSLQNLEQLWLSNNWLTDLTPLQTQTKLKWLHLDGTEAADLQPLNKLTQLKWLQLDNTRVDDITAIYPLTKLDWLHLKGNNTIPCSQFDQMEEILTPEKIDRPESCSQPQEQTGNPISTIEFQDQALKECVYDAAREQGITNAEELISLSCSDADITDITDITGLTQFPGITSINLAGNNHISCAQLDQLQSSIGEALNRPEQCNMPPTVAAQNEQTVTTGTQVDLNAEATDPNGDRLTYNWQQSAGQSIQLTNPNKATPNFIAPDGEDQTITFQLTVTDQYGLSTTQAINILVTAAILGSKDNPFLVTNYEDLKKVGTGIDGWNLDSHYLQTADIDAKPSRTENPIPDTEDVYYGFIPIGRSVDGEVTDEINQFKGSYNGGEYIIDGLMINIHSTHVGLFALAFNASLSNINLSNININGLNIVGGLAGQFIVDGATDVKLEYIYVSGNLKADHLFGGLIGQVSVYNGDNFVIDGIYVDVNIITAQGYYVGGMIGLVNGNNTVILNSSAVGGIDGVGTFEGLGGLVGAFMGENLTVSDSSSDVNITSSYVQPQKVGGLIGVYSGSNLKLTSSYSLGRIEFSGGGIAYHIGGLVGYLSTDETNLSLSGCFSSGDITISMGGDISFIGGMVGWLDGEEVSFVDNYSENKIELSGSYHQVIGGMAGSIYGGKVDLLNSYSTGDIDVDAQTGTFRIGGLVGELTGTNVIASRVFATGDVKSTYASDCSERIAGGVCGTWSGGLVGHVAGKIDLTNAYATGSVSGETIVGGLIGLLEEGANVKNSYARGNVTGNSQVGGLVGQMQHSGGDDENPATYSNITNSYSTGQVILQNEELEPIDFGGLVGASSSELNTVSNSFWDIETSDQETSAGGEPKTSEELKTTTIFTNADWDFHETWMILSEDYTYPRLAWNTIDVESWTDLHNMRNNMYANYVLTRDLLTSDADYAELAGPDANGGKGWEPVGTSEKPFMGTFDGGGYVIDGLNINRGSDFRIGMFGSVDGGDLLETHLQNVNTYGFSHVASLIGLNTKGVLNLCSVSGRVDAKDGIVGGLIGRNEQGQIINSSSNADIYGNGYNVGGLIGMSTLSRIENSNASGNVENEGSIVGGLVGVVYSSDILNSFATGRVTGIDRVGGVVGELADASSIIDSYAVGEVSASTNVGGLAGMAYGLSVIRNSNATGNVIAGKYYAGGLVGFANGADISDSYAEGDVNAIEHTAGGLVGYCMASIQALTASYATGGVSSNEIVGGLVGAFSGDMVASYSSGNVLGETYVGGLVGQLFNGNIENSFAVGTVDGSAQVGGFAGLSVGTITKSYSAGLVVGDTNTGGFVGFNQHGTYDDGIVIESFWDIETSGQETSAGGSGLTTAEMQDQYTYESAGWDFDSVWGYNYGEYPFLLEQDEITRIEFQTAQYTGTYSWDCDGTSNDGSTSIAFDLAEFNGSITGTVDYLGSLNTITGGSYNENTGAISFDVTTGVTTVANTFNLTYDPNSDDPQAVISGTTTWGDSPSGEGCQASSGYTGTITAW